jgi:hypothetical protein
LRGWRSAAIPLLVGFVLGVGGGAFGALTMLPSRSSDIRHDHASFRVFVEGRDLPFTDASFDFKSTRFASAHVHTSDPTTIHLEATKETPLANITLGDFFSAHGMLLSAGHLRLAPADGARDLVDDATSNLKVLVRHYEGQYATVPNSEAYRILPCDQILVSWGPRDESVAAQVEAVPLATWGTTYSACR